MVFAQSTLDLGFNRFNIYVKDFALPFLLCCKTKNPRLINPALAYLQRLVAHVRLQEVGFVRSIQIVGRSYSSFIGACTPNSGRAIQSSPRKSKLSGQDNAMLPGIVYRILWRNRHPPYQGMNFWVGQPVASLTYVKTFFTTCLAVLGNTQSQVKEIVFATTRQLAIYLFDRAADLSKG